MTDASPRERMIIDTHVHLLDPAQFPYPEPTTGYRPSQDENASLDDLRGVMEAHGVSAAVLVAASVYGADNASLIAALAAEPDRLRVIVGCDPEDPGTLNALARIPGVAGVRLNLTDDGAFAGGTERLRRLVARIGGLGLIACIQASPAAALAVIGGDGQTPVVLDHLGRPDLAGGLPALRRLAERSNTWLKLSGPFRIGAAVSGLSDWRRPAPLARAAVDQFQSNRLIWGSDWPFINLAGPRPGYRECLDWARDLVDAPFAANARGLFWERRHG